MIKTRTHERRYVKDKSGLCLFKCKGQGRQIFNLENNKSTKVEKHVGYQVNPKLSKLWQMNFNEV